MLGALFVCRNAYGQANPQPISPLKSGDKVLFIGNSFTEWSGRTFPISVPVLMRE